MKGIVLFLASLPGATASWPKIATYSPLSDVVPHNKIDLSAFGIIQALKQKAGISYTSPTNFATEAITTLAGTGKHIDLAHDLYQYGGGGSSPYAKFTGTANKAFLGNSKTSYSCTMDDNSDAAGAVTKTLGAPKSLYAADTTLFQIYFSNDLCGTIPDAGDIGDSLNGGNGVTDYVAPYDEPAPACPVFTSNLSPKTVTCTCPSCYNGQADTVVITYTAITRGGRSLRGFSTGGAAKMMNYEMKEFMDFKAMHGNDENAETFNDETIQMAFAALKTGAANAFSSCTLNGASVPTAATKNACSTAGGTFVQGNAMCKDKDTRVQKIPAGGNFDAQVADCAATNGKVTKFFPRKFKLNQEVIQKVMIYSVAWMYAIYEFEDGIQDCDGGAINNNDAGVHAWDEGVAFYTGSIAGPIGFNGGSYEGPDYNSGIMSYLLAVKRCENFGTCLDTNTGQAHVNKNLFKLFSAGQFCTHIGDCAGARDNLNLIIPQMRVPLIQGTLRYAYKVSTLFVNGVGTDDYEKAIGEGYAFMVSVVHAVHACNPADAKVIYDAMDLPGDGTTTAAHGLNGGVTYGQIKKAFEDNYACLGISCADVGTLYDGGQFRIGDGACVDVTFAPSAAPVASAPAPAPGLDLTVSPTTDGMSHLGLPEWGFIAVCAGGGVFLILLILIIRFRKKKNANLKKYNELQKQLQSKGATNLA